jgi:RNA polymerase sigma factor for flagellar operon FliA
MILTDADVKKYKAVVERHVKRFSCRTPYHITIEDIRGAAYIGLLEAAEKFDESLGWKFTTYASPRVVGAILDYLRARDWVPRETRRRTTELERAFKVAADAAQAAPSDEQIADAADMSLEDYYATVAVTVCRQNISLNSSFTGNGMNISEAVTDRVAVNPEREAGNNLFLRRALDCLNPKERAVIEGCDLGGATLKKVAEGLGIGESRACQLRKAAYSKMRAAA